MQNLVTIQRRDGDPRFVTVTVTDAGAAIANLSPMPVHSGEQKRQYIRNVLAAIGLTVRDFESGSLDPIFIVPARGISNRGFRAVAHLKTDILA